MRQRSATLGVPGLMLAASLLSAPAPACLAHAYVVTPVSMTLNTDDPRGEFRLVNQDSNPVRVQVDVQLWSQDGRRNQQVATDDFIVSPRFADIPAQGSQIVRVAYRRRGGLPQELSYRVMFRELPSPDQTGTARGVALNYSVPLFVVPPVAGSPQLAWQATQTGDSTLRVDIRNAGSVHSKIKFGSLVRQQHPDLPAISESELQRAVQTALVHYVLAGSQREMYLKLASPLTPGEHLLLTVDVDAKQQQIPLVVQ